MKPQKYSAAVLMLAITAVMSSVLLRNERVAADENSKPAAPVLVNTCLITDDVNRLTTFYAQVLQIEPHKEGEDYVEFRTDAGVLALFAADAQERYIPGSAAAGQNRSVILEFKVSGVDHEYARLQGIVKQWVKPPTNQPWGTRSVYFRDPDGNLVDLFEWVHPPGRIGHSM